MASVKAFVIDAEGKPLLPTHPARARRLLDTQRATLVRVVPYTIQLKRVVEQPVGDMTIGIDDGAKEVGIAVVNEVTREVVFTGTLHLRQDVTRKMTQRATYRRARRQRKTRYRKARFDRKKGDGWLAPTIRQKKDSIIRLVKDLQKMMPITQGMVEQGQFDISAMSAGHALSGREYQIPNYEGQEFREKVLWRDCYTCQRCGGKDNLQAHHIIYRQHGGTNTPSNGITLCRRCHQALHDGKWVLHKQPKQFKYPAHLQIGKGYLYQQLGLLSLQLERCVGWMTCYWRQQLRLDKSHVNDAIAMTCRDFLPQMTCRGYVILSKRKKVWEANPTKTCDEKEGFRHWDLVKAEHRSRGVVIGSVRSLKARVMTLRTGWDDNFPVAYSKSRVLWRFGAMIYI